MCRNKNSFSVHFHQGYRRQRAFIVTQMPLPETIGDFWQMLYDHRSPSIVLLHDVDHSDPEHEVSPTLRRCVISSRWSMVTIWFYKIIYLILFQYSFLVLYFCRCGAILIFITCVIQTQKRGKSGFLSGSGTLLTDALCSLAITAQLAQIQHLVGQSVSHLVAFYLFDSLFSIFSNRLSNLHASAVRLVCHGLLRTRKGKQKRIWKASCVGIWFHMGLLPDT